MTALAWTVVKWTAAVLALFVIADWQPVPHWRALVAGVLLGLAFAAQERL